MALRWLERRSPQRWNIPHRLAVGQDPDAEPVVVFYLPHNERDDATPQPAHSARQRGGVAPTLTRQPPSGYQRRPSGRHDADWRRRRG